MVSLQPPFECTRTLSHLHAVVRLYIPCPTPPPASCQAYLVTASGVLAFTFDPASGTMGVYRDPSNDVPFTGARAATLVTGYSSA